MILVGIGPGDRLYPGYRHRTPMSDLARSPFVGALAFLGRNSLAIYLIHQSMMIALLYLCGVMLIYH
jgi:uncharacterized membrane protein